MCEDGEVLQKLQDWWEENKRTLPWRSPDTSHFSHLVIEIILQRTRFAAVERIFPDFMERFPKPKYWPKHPEEKLKRRYRLRPSH